MALLTGVLHALSFVGKSWHLLLGTGDDTQGLLHDGGAQVHRFLLVGQVVSAG